MSKRDLRENLKGIFYHQSEEVVFHGLCVNRGKERDGLND
jgi:hypothetical protein